MSGSKMAGRVLTPWSESARVVERQGFDLPRRSGLGRVVDQILAPGASVGYSDVLAGKGE
jgi:hypothetical protein